VDDADLHPNARAVLRAADALGLRIEITTFPEGTRTAADAAASVGCDVDQIVKSLVFVLDGPEGSEAVLALVSGGNLLDEARLAAAAGGGTARRASAAAVREATGFAIGGVAPLGFPAPLRTFVDEDLLAFDAVWAAAGTPRDTFRVAPGDLVGAIGATVATLRRA
jgi:prolyl-tRNA editing enzyme YbaK/EbsC (Cys-tRNA(Pro) deacylase)